MYFSIDQFAKENHISKNKIKKMCPYIQGAYLCPCCKKWIIPENADLFYIPNKNCYNEKTKKYCYIMDAIDQKMLLIEEFTKMKEEECRTFTRELRENGFIRSIDGMEDNLDYRNYILTLNGAAWKDRKAKEKRELIVALLKTLQSGAELAAAAISRIPQRI